MNNAGNDQQPTEWICAKCNIPLVVGPVTASYLGSEFPVDLPKCPQCGFVLVTEELALGKMAEVEQTLEDK